MVIPNKLIHSYKIYFLKDNILYVYFTFYIQIPYKINLPLNNCNNTKLFVKTKILIYMHNRNT